MAAVIVALVGVALLALLAVGVAWQERNRVQERAIVYGVEESLVYVRNRLGNAAGEVLKPSDVRRILEWSVRYLQDPEVREHSDEPPVAGGEDAARYVQERSIEAGFAYDGDLIVEVLQLQTDFLASLGAVGDRVDDARDDRDEPGSG